MGRAEQSTPVPRTTLTLATNHGPGSFTATGLFLFNGDIMAKDTYRTSFDIPLRFKAYFDGLAHGEKRLVIEKLLDLVMTDDEKTGGMTTVLLLADKISLELKER